MAETERDRTPGPSRMVRVSTQAAPPRERFDLWRSLFAPTPIELATEAPASRFRGRYGACLGADGVALIDIDCDATRTRMAPGEGDHVLISGLVHGELLARDGQDRRTRSVAGRLHIMDTRDGGELLSSGHRNIYLAAPRALATRALGRDRIGVATLPDTPLAALLWAHMREIARMGDAMSAQETAAAMQAASAMASVVLRQMGEASAEDAEMAPGADIVLAADRFMAAHRHRPGLTAADVAAGVGCSRARLYRLFAAQGRGVADALRDHRLGHGEALLAAGREVGDVALACGYADASSFGKAFRRRHGLSPGDWRARRLGL